MAKKILLIDDDQYIRELYEEVLKGEGYEVDMAVDGAEGLEKITGGGYDLVLLDVMLPKLDGIGILTKTGQNPPKTKNGLIVLLTNLSLDPTIQNSLKMGASGYIIKAEVTPSQFLEKVKGYLS